MIEQLKKLNEEIAEMKRLNMEKSKAIFNEVSKSLFEKHSILEKFSWAQYTPYFNDGDECVFSVSEYTIRVNELGDDDEEISDTRWDSTASKSLPNEKQDKALAAAFKDVSELITTVDEQAMRDMFDDHVEITVNRDGEIEVEEYSHD